MAQTCGVGYTNSHLFGAWSTHYYKRKRKPGFKEDRVDTIRETGLSHKLFGCTKGRQMLSITSLSV